MSGDRQPARGKKPSGAGRGGSGGSRPSGGSRSGPGKGGSSSSRGSSGPRRDDRSGGSRSGSPRSGSSRGDDRSGGSRSGGSRSGPPRRDDRSGGPRRDDRSGGPRRDDRGGDTRGRGDRGRGGSSGEDRGGRTQDDTGRPEAGPKSWGSVARRGAAKIGEEPFTEDEAFSPEEIASYEKRVAKRAAIEAGRQRLRDEAKEAVSRSGGTKPKRKAPRYAATERAPLPDTPRVVVDADVALIKALGKDEGRKAWKMMLAAFDDFSEGRYRPAQNKLKKLSDMAPAVAEVHELLGLVLYRQSKWAAACKELELFRELSGSTEQHPVLADAYRAQKRWADVDELWAELRDVSPSAALVTEGRVVAAGAQADQGDLAGAIRTLEKKWTRPKRPKEHHLSRAYALADLYERSGDAPRARDLFAWVAQMNPRFADAAERSR